MNEGKEGLGSRERSVESARHPRNGVDGSDSSGRSVVVEWRVKNVPKVSVVGGILKTSGRGRTVG